MPTSGIVRVALPVPLRRVFDYLPPESLPLPAAGARVRVPFGTGNKVGVVLGHADSSDIDSERLKPIGEVLDAEPLIDDELMGLCRWAAGYYQHGLGDVLVGALPVRLREGHPAHVPGRPLWRITDQAPRSVRGNAKLQQAVLECLRAHDGPVGTEAFSHITGGWRPALRAMVAAGWVQSLDGPCLPSHQPHPGAPPKLNPEQEQAVDTILSAPGFNAFLLDGVTGSGKTEVYLRLVEHCLRHGRQALILVPEIGLTPQLLRRFRKRIDAPIAVLHSGLNGGERACAWLSAARGHARVLIGTRSAVFTPLPEPGLIIVDEEHDPSLKQQDGFRYSGRDVAVMRARRVAIPVVLGSATPSLESLHNVRRARYRRLVLSERAGAAAPPAIRLLDVRGDRLSQGLSNALLQAVQKHLDAGGQALLFINRRGFAPVLSCHDCGWVSACAQCDAHMVVHRGERRLRCHHCGAERGLPRVCPACRSEKLIHLGQGTERIEDSLRERFPDIPVLRLDRDNTRRKGSLDTLLEQARSGEARILVGTQMLAKGHHFPDLSLVGIVDADSGLYSADFRGLERMAQLITQVAGRSGRAGRAGEVLIQTRHADDPNLRLLLERGYGPLAERLLDERAAAALPPHAAMALLRAQSRTREALDAFLIEAAAQALRLAGDARQGPTDAGAVQVWGPVPAPMERRGGQVRGQILCLGRQRAALHGVLTPWVQWLENARVGRRVRWSLDVDPADTF
ncbi:MAG: primosomal protein N' [Gammaproteobacteria bacterium]